MARTVKTIQAKTLAALKTAIDAYLATFTAGASVVVVGCDIVQIDQPRQLGSALIAIITHDTVGAAAMSAPFVFNYVSAGNADDMTTDLQAAYTALVAAFTSGARNLTARDDSKLNQITAWFMSGTDAADSATNWAIE